MDNGILFILLISFLALLSLPLIGVTVGLGSCPDCICLPAVKTATTTQIEVKYATTTEYKTEYKTEYVPTYIKPDCPKCPSCKVCPDFTSEREMLNNQIKTLQDSVQFLQNDLAKCAL